MVRVRVRVRVKVRVRVRVRDGTREVQIDRGENQGKNTMDEG